MGRTILATITIEEDDIKDYVDDCGGEYDECDIWKILNGAFMELPFNNDVSYITFMREENHD